MYDVHCQVPGDIARLQKENLTLDKAILVAGASAIRNPGNWTVVYRKTGKVALLLRGMVG